MKITPKFFLWKIIPNLKIKKYLTSISKTLDVLVQFIHQIFQFKKMFA